MTSMRDLIVGLPDQLRWAGSLDPLEMSAAADVIVTGMGGSGMAGDVARVVAAAAGRRVEVHKGYGLPSWVSGDELVVAVSHSGNTEETLSSAAAALAGRHPTVVVTTGGELRDLAATEGLPMVIAPEGPQPRAALGYLAGGVLRVLEAAGCLPPQGPGLAEAADVCSGLLESDADGASDLAASLAGLIVMVFGGPGVGEVAAARWKTQINENAKTPAAAEAIPEADHNTIVGWTAHPDLGRSSVGAVFLRDSGDSPAVSRRIDLTRRVVEDAVAVAGTVDSRGGGTIARLFSLVLIGDLLSVELAERAGVDPMPVEAIEEFKSRLVEEPQ